MIIIIDPDQSVHIYQDDQQIPASGLQMLASSGAVVLRVVSQPSTARLAALEWIAKSDPSDPMDIAVGWMRVEEEG